jgi:hypothetical protein
MFYHEEASPTQTPWPVETERQFEIPCIAECVHLNDRELITNAILDHCEIQEENSRDCMQMLWCLACSWSPH